MTSANAIKSLESPPKTSEYFSANAPAFLSTDHFILEKFASSDRRGRLFSAPFVPKNSQVDDGKSKNAKTKPACRR